MTKTLRISATLFFYAATLLSGVPAWSQYDAFELPPGVENTRIPKRLTPSTQGRTGASPEDIRRLETYRMDIQRLYAAHNYAEAQPYYERYVSLLEKVHADNGTLASALRNYADLLRKLDREAEAGAIEVKASSLLTADEQASLTYGLKEYRLGMSLDDFTKLTPPGGEATKVKGICSCDSGQTVEVVTQQDKDAKVVQCGLWKIGSKDFVSEPWSMTVAKVPCSPDFRFVESDGVYRLYEISISFFSSNYEDIKRALIDKYGQPTSTEVEKMRTEMGNNFPLTNLIWDNGVSKIRLANADGQNTGRVKLRYIHRQLFLAYAKRINDSKDGPTRHASTDL